MSFVKDIRLVQRNWKEGNQGIYCVILLLITLNYIVYHRSRIFRVISLENFFALIFMADDSCHIP